jgi:hypothetical protein
MDMHVFEHGIEVAVNKHFHAAKNFAKRHKRRIYLHRVTNHLHDPSVIRVIGKSKGWFFEKNQCIGYVPADIADKLVRTDTEDKVEVRLQMISINRKQSIAIRFDILGTKDDYKKYSSIF